MRRVYLAALLGTMTAFGLFIGYVEYPTIARKTRTWWNRTSFPTSVN